MELVLLFLLFGGGIATAAVLMIAASLKPRKTITLFIFIGLSSGCLFGQASCWAVAAGIGRATGGEDSPGMERLVFLSFVFLIACSAALLLFRRRRQ